MGDNANDRLLVRRELHEKHYLAWGFEAKWWFENSPKRERLVIGDAAKLMSCPGLQERFLLTFWCSPIASWAADVASVRKTAACPWIPGYEGATLDLAYIESFRTHIAATGSENETPFYFALCILRVNTHRASSTKMRTNAHAEQSGGRRRLGDRRCTTARILASAEIDGDATMKMAYPSGNFAFAALNCLPPALGPGRNGRDHPSPRACSRPTGRNRPSPQALGVLSRKIATFPRKESFSPAENAPLPGKLALSGRFQGTATPSSQIHWYFVRRLSPRRPSDPRPAWRLRPRPPRAPAVDPKVAPWPRCRSTPPPGSSSRESPRRS